MPTPVAPASQADADRARLALYFLRLARRRLIDSKPYLDGTDAGRNFDGLIAALESRIDRIRLHGLGEPIAVSVGSDADTPAFIEGYPTVPE